MTRASPPPPPTTERPPGPNPRPASRQAASGTGQSSRDADNVKQSFEMRLERAARSAQGSAEATGKQDEPTVTQKNARDGSGGSDTDSGNADHGRSDDNSGFDTTTAAREPSELIAARQPVNHAAALDFAAFMTTATTADPEQAAMLQRMAAAIAEIAGTGNDPKMTVEFGKLSGFAESAIIARDRAGAFTVTLIGAAGQAHDARAAALAAQLHDRLLRRRIKIASVDFAAATLTDDPVSRKS